MKKLGREFYNRDSITVAKDLLGKLLVREIGGRRISARIVEAEAYMGVVDRAAHSYAGKRTARVEVLYGGPGYAYVYLIYGMYSCFNVVAGDEGNPLAVLIRAAHPEEGVEWMACQRYKKSLAELSEYQKKGLTNGPGKLCVSLAIDRALNGADLCGDKLYIEEGGGQNISIVSAKRVGVDYAGEAKDYLWRFYIKDSEYVSVK